MHAVAPDLEVVPLGQVVQLLGVSQLSSYAAWPFPWHRFGGMYWPAGHVEQLLESQFGEQLCVQLHESAATAVSTTSTRMDLGIPAIIRLRLRQVVLVQ